MTRSTQSTVYPPGYVAPRTMKQQTRQFNNWCLYIRSETMGDGLIKQVRKILEVQR